MNAPGRYHFLSLLAMLDLATCAAGFGLVSWLHSLLAGPAGSRGVWSGEWLLGLSVSAATFWLATPFWESGAADALRLWIEQFFTALGFILIVQSALAYMFLISPVPWSVILAGTVVTIVFMALARLVLYPAVSKAKGVLIVGYDSIAQALAPSWRGRVAGLLDSEPGPAGSGIPYLGDPSRVGDAVASRQPERIVLSRGLKESGVSPKVLLRMRFSGIAIDEGAALYEDVLGRVRWDRLQPADFLFASPLNATRSVMALQAVYTNLIGLALLALLSPLLLATALLVLLASGRGPVLERIECAGFQRIPFHLLRFRTRRKDGTETSAGRWIIRLRLVNLPQLLNIIRGEMSLFGPSSARREFADALCDMIPLYAQRFLVKPGMLGWSQVNLRATPVLDEAVRLEFDLYYVKHGSPSLDLEIFLRTLVERPFSPRPRRREAEGPDV
jgi:lipopolysaccharide/colanic/teichoic acid biosynthesis glycosyltransferase